MFQTIETNFPKTTSKFQEMVMKHLHKHGAGPAHFSGAPVASHLVLKLDTVTPPAAEGGTTFALARNSPPTKSAPEEQKTPTAQMAAKTPEPPSPTLVGRLSTLTRSSLISGLIQIMKLNSVSSDR
jgi:hypothetical protein